MSEKRLQHIDVARGIAIICIILGHLGISEINRFVFTFHVPIFYLITGYFIKPEGKMSDFIKGKFRTLILPYISTCIIIIVLSVIINLLSSPNGSVGATALEWLYASLYGAGDTYREPFYIKSIGGIWFLLASFWGTLFLKLILGLKDHLRVFSVIALFLIGYFSRELFWFPLSIQAGMCAALFMYIGYLWKDVYRHIESLTKECRIFLTASAFAVWIFFVIDFKSFWLVHCDIGRGVVDIFSSLCAVLCVMLISKLITEHFTKLSDALAYIGKYSIIMLCAHIVELNLFPWYRIALTIDMSEQVELLVIISGKILWSIAITYLFSRRNLTRRIFGLKPLE